MRHSTTRTWLLLVPALLWLGFFLAAPLAMVAVASLMEPGAPVAFTPGLGAYQRLFDSVHLTIIARSFWLAVLATLFCLAIGFPLAWTISRQPPARQRLLFLMVLAPLAANSLILIYAWITLLRPAGLIETWLQAAGFAQARLGVLYGPAGVLIGLIYWHLPFMVYPVYVGLGRLDPRLFDAASDLGADRWARLRHVLLPLAWPGLAAGSALVFVQSFSGFLIPDLLGGGMGMMIGNLVHQRFLFAPQDWPLGSALTLVLLLALGGGLALVFRLQRRSP